MSEETCSFSFRGRYQGALFQVSYLQFVRKAQLPTSNDGFRNWISLCRLCFIENRIQLKKRRIKILEQHFYQHSVFNKIFHFLDKLKGKTYFWDDPVFKKKTKWDPKQNDVCPTLNHLLNEFRFVRNISIMFAFRLHYSWDSHNTHKTKIVSVPNICND